MSTYCNFCGSYKHATSSCKLEKEMAPFLKKEVGIIMEAYVETLKCPICLEKKLKVLGNNKPSIDVICENCDSFYEIKSKCMSSKSLPSNIYCNGGNYIELNKSIINGLNLILIIYAVDRKTKQITIRNIYYAPNSLLFDKKIIEINKKDKTSLSIININDLKFLKLLPINTNKISLHKLYKELKFDFSILYRNNTHFF